MAVNLKSVAERLRFSRETLQYSVDEACQATGLIPERLTAIESGNVRPSGDEVLILAGLYDCDFRAILDEKLAPPLQEPDILFRRYGESFRKEDRRAVQEFLHLCQIEASLESLLGQKPVGFSFQPTGNYNNTFQ